MIELRTDAEINQMKAAGAFVSQTLSALLERVDIGVNLLDLDAFAQRWLIRSRILVDGVRY